MFVIFVFSSELLRCSNQLANNDLIIENILKWIEPSYLIKCSQVCKRWNNSVARERSKRRYFHHINSYTLLPSNQNMNEPNEILSIEELLNSFNVFIDRNQINQFKFIMVFSKFITDNNSFYWKRLINCFASFIKLTHSLPNDCKILHINSEAEIITSTSTNDESMNFHEFETNNLNGISCLLMSRGFAGIKTKIYIDSEVFNLKFDQELKCIILFNQFYSAFGSFTKLKRLNDCYDNLINIIAGHNYIPFGGAVVDRLNLITQTNADDLLSRQTNYIPINDIICLTFNGENVFALSKVFQIDDSNLEEKLYHLKHELKPNYDETIAIVFSLKIGNAIDQIKKVFSHFKIRIIGICGCVHGVNSHESNIKSNVFNLKNHCTIIIIQLRKKV